MEGKGEGVRRKRKTDEEGRGGHEGTGRLSQGKNRGEKEKRYHNRGSHYRFKRNLALEKCTVTYKDHLN